MAAHRGVGEALDVLARSRVLLKEDAGVGVRLQVGGTRNPFLDFFVAEGAALVNLRHVMAKLDGIVDCDAVPIKLSLFLVQTLRKLGDALIIGTISSSFEVGFDLGDGRVVEGAPFRRQVVEVLEREYVNKSRLNMI